MTCAVKPLSGSAALQHACAHVFVCVCVCVCVCVQVRVHMFVRLCVRMDTRMHGAQREANEVHGEVLCVCARVRMACSVRLIMCMVEPSSGCAVLQLWHQCVCALLRVIVRVHKHAWYAACG